jgi:hypothetical protein
MNNTEKAGPGTVISFDLAKADASWLNRDERKQKGWTLGIITNWLAMSNGTVNTWEVEVDCGHDGKRPIPCKPSRACFYDHNQTPLFVRRFFVKVDEMVIIDTVINPLNVLPINTH